MRKILAYSFILSAAFLIGCNSTSTSTSSDNASSRNATNETAAEPSGDSSTAGSQNALETLVNNAQFVFSGELLSSKTRMSNHNIPHTFHTYRVDKVIKGRYDGKTYSVGTVGGSWADGRTLRASTAPDVTPGEQAVLMVDPDSETGCMLVHCYHGHLVIEGDNVIAANGSKILIDDDHRVKFIAKEAEALFKGQSDKMSTKTVLNYLKGIADRSSNNNKIIDPVDINLSFDSPRSLFEGSPAPDADGSAAKNRAPRSNKLNEAFDNWEVAQLEANGGSPVLTSSFTGEGE